MALPLMSAALGRRRIGVTLLAALLFVASIVDAGALATTATATKSTSSSRRRGSGGSSSSSALFTRLSAAASASSAVKKRKDNLEGSMPRTVAIYSTGFATPEVDGHWGDWARKVDRAPAEAKKLQIAPLVDPPSRLAAAYRPLSGPYSSRDPAVVASHLRSLAAAGVGGVLTYCSAPTVAAVEPSKAAVRQGLLVSAAGGAAASSTTTTTTTTRTAGGGGRQLLLQQEQQPQQQEQQPQAKAAAAAAASSSSSSSSASSSSVRIVRAERPTNASALSTLVAQAAVLGLGVGFVVPEYRHRNARTVRDDLRWCVEVAQAAVAGSAAARGALAARSPAAARAQPLAPLLSHGGKAVFLVKAAASIPCHHWTALLKPGGAFSVREEGAAAGTGGGGEKGSGRAEEREAEAKGGPRRRKQGRGKGSSASAVAGAGAVSGTARSLLAVAASSSTATTATAKTTVKSAFSASASSSSNSQQQQLAQPSAPPSQNSTPVSLDGAWFAEWRDRDDGDVAASCGFDGVATFPGDDGADASDASSAENDKVEPVPFGAEPGNWPAMRARARRQGLAFWATVSPGSDATPVRPWSTSKVRSREPGGARYSRLWRYAALSGPDAVVVDSFNDWNEGTQIEPAAAAAGCGGGGGGGGNESESGDDEKNEGEKSSASSSAATALGPQCAPDVRSYAEGEESGASSSSSSGGKKQQQQAASSSSSHLYMRLTASEAARAAAVMSRVGGRASYEPPRALASQLEGRRRQEG